MRKPTGKRRFQLLPAACVLLFLAFAAISCGGINGITFVGQDSEGVLHTGSRKSCGDIACIDLYKSSDGGLTWQYVDNVFDSPIERSVKAVTSPRGQYTLDETKIVRDLDGRQETVYSADYLLDKANSELQQRDKPISRYNPAEKLYSIHYDVPSGNIIATLGTQGVLVETPDGNWTRIGVGPFQPTDFSASARTKLLFLSPTLWTTALLLAISLTSIATILAVCRWRDIAGAVIIGAAVSAAIAALILLSNYTSERRDVLTDVLIFLVILGPPTAIFTAFGLLIGLPTESAKRKGLALVVTALAAAGAVALFPGFFRSYLPTNDHRGLMLTVIALLSAAGIALAFTSAVPYFLPRPDWRYWFAVIGMQIWLIHLPVILWFQYIITEQTAHITAPSIAAAIALAWFLWVKWGQREPAPSHPAATEATAPRQPDTTRPLTIIKRLAWAVLAASVITITITLMIRTFTN